MIVSIKFYEFLIFSIAWVMVKNSNGQEYYEREDFVGEYIFESEEVDDQFHEYM